MALLAPGYASFGAAPGYASFDAGVSPLLGPSALPGGIAVTGAGRQLTGGSTGGILTLENSKYPLRRPLAPERLSQSVPQAPLWPDYTNSLSFGSAVSSSPGYGTAHANHYPVHSHHMVHEHRSHHQHNHPHLHHHHHHHHHHRHHHASHNLPELPEDSSDPISPYPELPQELQIHRDSRLHDRHEHHPGHHGGHHHGRYSGHHGRHHYDHGRHHGHHGTHLGTFNDHRKDIGLPDFPVEWVEDKHHSHLMTYEKMIHMQEEFRLQRLKEEGQPVGPPDLGLATAVPTSDLEAVDMARATGHLKSSSAGIMGEQVPLAHTAAGQAYRAMSTGDLTGLQGGPQALAGPIARAVERFREHAARAHAAAQEASAQLGPSDPRTSQAQAQLMQAEAALHGAQNVQSAVASNPPQRAEGAMHATVEALRIEAEKAQLALLQARTDHGDQDHRTHGLQMSAMKANATFEGAEEAVSQLGREDFRVSESPEAIANRAAAAADAYRAEADMAQEEATRMATQYGAKDQRVIQTQELARRAADRMREADAEASAAQATLRGQAPLPAQGMESQAESPAPKKKQGKKKVKKGWC